MDWTGIVTEKEKEYTSKYGEKVKASSQAEANKKFQMYNASHNSRLNREINRIQDLIEFLEYRKPKIDVFIKDMENAIKDAENLIISNLNDAGYSYLEPVLTKAKGMKDNAILFNNRIKQDAAEIAKAITTLKDEKTTLKSKLR